MASGTNTKNKNTRNLHRGINECNKSYEPGIAWVKDEKRDLLADSHNTWNRLLLSAIACALG
jgi:hypothetical protein